MKRRVLTAEQQQQLRQWFAEERLSLAAVWRKLQTMQPPWELKRTTLDTYRREILGSASESAASQVRLAGEENDGEDDDGSEVDEGEEASASPPMDELDQIQQQLKKVLKLGLATKDLSVAEKALRTAMAVTKQLDALRLSRQPDRAPAAVVYLPAELPDPNVYDPNDPASWPDNPYLAPPLAPDPALFPPGDPASWPHNPYGCPGRVGR